MKKNFILLLAIFLFGITHAQNIEKYQIGENSQAAPSRAQGALLNENFSGIFPPAGWKAEGLWMTAEEAFANVNSAPFPKTNGDTYYAAFDAYSGVIYTSFNLITPSLIPTADYSILYYDVTEFYMEDFDAIASGMQLFVEISEDNGITWTTGTDVLAAYIPNHNDPLVHNLTITLALNLESYIGQVVKVRFRAISDGGAFILALDDVRGVSTYIYDHPELEISKFNSLPYSQVPLAHVVNILPSAIVVNNGADMTSMSSITFASSSGNYNQTVIIPDLGSLELINTSPSVGYLPSETALCTITATINFVDQNMENNVASKVFAITEDIYAMDYGTYVEGIGVVDGSIGNIFELIEPSVIESFYVAFSSAESAPFTLRIYTVNEEENAWSSLLYESPILNRNTSEAGLLTEYAIPPQLLSAGKYLFAVYSTVNIGVMCDGVTPSAYYTPLTTGQLSATNNSINGNLAIRIKTGTPPVVNCFPDLPYTMDFEPSESSGISCWTSISMNDNFHNTPGVSTDHSHSGSRSWRFSSAREANNYNQYLISPQLAESEINKFISFYYRAQSALNTESFRVGYSTTDNQTSSFTWGDAISCETIDWTLYESEIPLNARYIAIHYNVASSQGHFYVDEIGIDHVQIDPCAITFPYTVGFNEEVFPPECWTSESTTSRFWDRATTGVTPECSPQEGSGMLQYHCRAYPNGSKAVLISPPIDNSGDPLLFNFYMYRDGGLQNFMDKVNIYVSDTTIIVGDPILTIHRNYLREPESMIGWNNYTVELPTDIPTLYIIVEGHSIGGYNIYMDNFIIGHEVDMPCAMVSHTPEMNATIVPVNAEVSATFNQNIVAIDLSNITITPDPGGVSATISGNKLTIIHDDFDYGITYTVTIPEGSIENVADEISWSFTSVPLECVNVALPYSMGFESNEESALNCWKKVSVARLNPLAPSTTYSYSGARSFRFCSNYSGYDPNQYLISPQLAAVSEDIYLGFYYRRYDMGAESFRVGYSTTDNEISSFTWFNSVTDASTTWQLYETIIPEDARYIAIHYNNTSNMLYLYVDDLKIDLVSNTASTVLSRTPEINATAVEIDAEVSVTFNRNIAGLDLSGITITPDPGGVSVNISSNKMIIEHNDFDCNTHYTVNIPEYAISGLYNAISWSFTTTSGTIFTYPHIIDFNDSHYLTDCWKRVPDTGYTAWSRVTSGSNPSCYSYEGGGMVQFNSHLAPENATGYLISPPFDNSEPLVFNFWMYRSTSNSDHINIYASSTPTVSGNPIMTLYQNTSIAPIAPVSGWNVYNVALPENMPIVYIIIEGVSNAGRNIYLDRLTIAPAADIPRYLRSTTPGSNAIDIALNTEVSATFDQNITGLDLTGITIIPDPGNVSASIQNRKLTISHDDFEYGTTYTVIIPGGSIQGVPNQISWSFSTAYQCDAITFPHTMGFEFGEPYTCWNLGSAFLTPTTDAHTGSHLCRLNSSGNRIISPELPVTSEAKVISLWHRKGGTSGRETFRVEYSTTDNDAASFTSWGPTITSENPPTWEYYEFDLPAEAKYVSIRYNPEGLTQHFYLYIDDITIGFESTFPRTILSRTPYVNEMQVELERTVSVTYNRDITAIDLTGITITPDPGGVTAYVSGAVLTIDHDDFAPESIYTVHIPVGAIANVAEDISWSFTTRYDCNSINFPYTMDFEFGEGYECWSSIGSYTLPEVSSEQAQTGIRSCRFSSSFAGYNDNQYLISPELPVTATEKTFSLYHHKNNSASVVFRIGYSTTNNAITSFTWLEQIYNTNNMWLFYEVTTIPRNAKYIAIYHVSNPNNTLYVDNITIDTIVPPVIISRTPDIDETQVEPDAMVSVTFDKSIMPLVQSAITITPNPGGVSTTISGAVLSIAHNRFAPNTIYTVNIPANSLWYIDEDISWSFTTGQYCEAITYLPCIMGFEEDEPMDCWRSISMNEENSTGYSNSLSHSGLAGWQFSSSETATNYNQYLISPQLPATSIEKQLTFYYRSHSESGNEVFRIGYSTTNNQISSFIWLNDVTDASTTWQLYDINVAENVRYIAINYASEEEESLYIDDITIMETVPPTVLIYTPNTHETGVAINAGVSLTFDKEISALNLSGITISPNPGGVSASVSGEVLSINHHDFNYGLTYTVTIPAGTIKNVLNAISWSFSTANSECEINTLPYTMGFESDELYGCWTSVYSGTVNVPGLTTNEAHSGTQSWRFISYNNNSPYGYNQYLISPELPIGDFGKYIKLYHRRYAIGTESFRVGYSTTGNQIDDFEWLESVTDITTSWQLFETTDIPANAKYIAIHYNPSGRQRYLYVDDIEIGFLDENFPRFVTSRTPEINETQVQQDATVAVTFNMDLTAIDLTTISISPDPGGVSATISGNVLTIDHHDFEYNTTYTVNIPTDAIQSLAQTISWSFTTTMDCNSFVLPLTMGFESDEEQALGCWTAISMNTINEGEMGTATVNPYSGSRSWRFNSMANTENYNQYLISPQLPISSNGKKISFYHRIAYTSRPRSFRIGFSSTDSQLDSFIWGEVVIPGNSTWQLYESSFPVNAKYVAINYDVTDRYNYLYVDNITIDTLPEDTPPTVFAVTPPDNEIDVAVDAAVAVFFNVNITGLDLNAITISPNPGGVSASISGNVLTIAHDDFDNNVTYTVTVPTGTIANYDHAITWTFTTELYCSNIPYPYMIGFNDATFPPDCWKMYPISGNGVWKWIEGEDRYPTCSPYEGIGMIQFNSFSYNLGTTGRLTSPALSTVEEPLTFSFWMYRNNVNTGQYDRVNIYFSTSMAVPSTPNLTINRGISDSPTVPSTGWYEYNIALPDDMPVVYIIVEGVSGGNGNNIYLDNFTIAPTANFPRMLFSYTPNDDAVEVALDAVVSATFNLDITESDFSTITISPDPGGVSFSISGNVLTIAHDDFEMNTTYTVTIPSNAIENLVAGATWSFKTETNCDALSYPYMVGFNEDIFPPACWISQSSTNTPWKRVTSGSYPSCSPQEGTGMIQYDSYQIDYSGKKGVLISPELDNSEQMLFSFYMYRNNEYSTDIDKVNIYASATPAISGNPILVIPRVNTEPPTSEVGWHNYIVELPTDMPTLHVIVEGESAYGNNMLMDNFIISSFTNFPRMVTSHTPAADEMRVAVDAEVSATFNVDIVGLDLSTITISPDPGGVSANISGNMLTIAHHNFDHNTTYTVTIPVDAIQSLAGEVSWSFTTTMNCSDITYPYIVNFNETIFPPECWTLDPASGNGAWLGIIGNGTTPTCSPQEGSGMIQYKSYTSGYNGVRGRLISPELNNEGDPLAFKFRMYRDNGYSTSIDKVNIYFSSSTSVPATPDMTINRPISSPPVVTSNGWYEYTIMLPTDMPIVYIIVEGVGANGNNIYMDNFNVIFATDLYPQVLSTTPENNAIDAAVAGEVSVTFNMDITAIDLSGITIDPDPGNVSGSVSGRVLTISHNDFDYDTDYTVTIPAGAIQDVTTEISWSFKTVYDCDNIALPIAMGFEDDEHYECWTSISMNNQINNRPRRLTNYANTGTYSWRFSSIDQANDYNQYLISPPLPINLGGKLISFYYLKGYTESGSFRVGYSTTDNQISSFEWFNSVPVSLASWQLYENQIPANSKYVAIHYLASNGAAIYVDDIIIDALPDDTPLTLLNRTPGVDEGQVALDAPVSVTFNRNITEIELSNITISPDPGGVLATISGSVLSITHNEFDYNTTYTVTIPANTIENFTDAISWSFKTTVNCSDITYPYIVDFNDMGFPPNCWSLNPVSGYGVWKRIEGGGEDPTCSPQEGNGMLQYNSNSYYYNGIRGFLISPELNNTGDPLMFSFWMYRDNASLTYLDYVNIYFSSSTSVPATPDMTIHRPTTSTPVVSSSGWYEYTLRLPVDMPVVYIIIEGVGAFGNNIYMDNFTVSYVDLLPRLVVSHTPGVDEMQVVPDAEVSVTFNLNITGLDLSAITISPDPGGVSATTSGEVLTIAHDDFDYETTYTVTIPVGAIENVADAISWSFTTTFDCNTMITLPYTMGFESTEPYDCWTSIHYGTTNTPGLIGMPTHTGSQSWRFNSININNNPYGYNQYLISPELPVSSEAKYISFWYRRASIGTETFRVGYSSTNTDLESFTWRESVSDASYSEWKECRFAFPPEAKYFAIHYNVSSSLYYLYIDDIFIDFTDSDFPRSVASRTPGIDAVNVEINADVSVTFDLDINGLDLSAIEISPNLGNVSASISGTVLTIAHDDFEYDTTYTVNIPPDAIENVSYPITWSFTTVSSECESITLPYTMGFETSEEDALNCWIYSSMNTSNTIGLSSTFANDGANSLRFNSFHTVSSSGGNYNQYLISPRLPIDSPDEFYFSFYYRKHTSGSESFRVGYSTTDNQIHNFTWLNSVTNASISWQLYEVGIPQDAKYIAINYNNTNSQYYLYVDDLKIELGTEIPRSVVSRTPDIDATQVNIDAEVSITFNLNPIDLDLSGIEISPDPGNISASISGRVLTIAHDNFDYETIYTVTIPANTIQSVTEPITWSFKTIFDCDNITLPYTMGFEIGGGDECWTSNYSGIVNVPKITNTEAHTGTQSWQFSSFGSNTDYNQYLISPKLPMTFTEKSIRFNYRKSNSATELFRVGYSTTDQSISSFTWFDEVADFSTFWQLYEENTIPESAQYIAIHYYSNNKYHLYIDDITIDSVPPPVIVSLTPEADETLVEIGATVSITFDKDISAYNLSGITISPDPGGVSATISGNVLNIAHNDFSFETTYFVSIPENTIHYYAEAITWSFRTTANCNLAADLPYTMGFEAEEVMDCWEAISMNELNTLGYTDSPTHSDLAAWQFASVEVAENYSQYLITPILPITSNEKYFSFYYRKSDSSTETFRVGYSTTDNAIDSFTWLSTVNDATTTDWQLYETTIPEETQYIAIHYNTENNGHYLYLDDITVSYYNMLSTSVSNYHDYGTTPVATITPENISVLYNDNKEIDITVDPAYELHALFVTIGNSAPVEVTSAVTQNDNVYNYLLNNITEDTHVEAVIKVKNFVLNFTVQTGKGEVNGVLYDATTTPQSFQQTVNYEYSLLLNPDYGYVIEDLMIDAVSVGSPDQYQFEQILSDHQIDIYFSEGTFTITTEIATGQGNITQGETFAFDPAYTFYYHVEADAGFRIIYVTLDDVIIPESVNAGESYSDSIPAPIGENHSLKAYLSNVSIIYTVYSGKGYIENDPDPIEVVDDPIIKQIWLLSGTSHTASFRPETDYRIAQVIINGVNMGVIDEYLFENITENQSVDIYFELIACQTPSNLRVSDITKHSAILQWDDVGAESYIVEHKTLEDPFYNAVVTTTNQYAYLDLTEATTYVWRVKAVCATNDESEWSELSTFQTLGVGIQDDILSQISVYAHLNNVNIINETGIPINQVSIYNIYGQQIYHGNLLKSKETITLSVTNGTYLVRLATDLGVINYKVVIIW